MAQRPGRVHCRRSAKGLPDTDEPLYSRAMCGTGRGIPPALGTKVRRDWSEAVKNTMVIDGYKAVISPSAARPDTTPQSRLRRGTRENAALTLLVPNATTIEAMREARRGNLSQFATVASLGQAVFTVNRTTGGERVHTSRIEAAEL